jgi:hypothetical protein
MATRATRRAVPPKLGPKRNIASDRLDLRDRPYMLRLVMIRTEDGYQARRP